MKKLINRAMVAQLAWLLAAAILGSTMRGKYGASALGAAASVAIMALALTAIVLAAQLIRDRKGLRKILQQEAVEKWKMPYVALGITGLFGLTVNLAATHSLPYFQQMMGNTGAGSIPVMAMILGAVIAVAYGMVYSQLGFQKSLVPCVWLLVIGCGWMSIAGGKAGVFFGLLLMLTGFFSGITTIAKVLDERIPAEQAGAFRSISVIPQILLPGVVGPLVGALLPDRGIWIGALAGSLLVALGVRAMYRMMRNGHYDLWTEAGERVRDERGAGIRTSGWEVHPRPQRKREKWMLLNENWKLNDHAIRMPYPPQSLLADYPHPVGARLTYETTFRIPADFDQERILLHFDAVDQIADVYVNSKAAGHHEGGYLAFELDITELVDRGAENRLVVKVIDTLDRKYPYGKQCKKRGGMWYTPVSGIWQSVWLENVPSSYIKNIVMKPDLDGLDIRVESASETIAGDTAFGEKPEKNADGFRVRVTLSTGEVLEQSFSGSEGRLQLRGHVLADGSGYEPKLWSVEEPYLYHMTIFRGADRVETYFALRTIAITKMAGVNRVCLNGEPIFLHGLLDQGYYSDGIYLPAEPEEYERDILRMKELGFNLLRKHIKVEPEWFYYYCDLHGMLVMQDMVNNGGYSFVRDTALPTLGMKKMKDISGWEGERKEIFRQHTAATIRQLYNHPSIVAYTIFNEAWGQFESDRMYDYVKELDDSRLIDSTSGWFWQTKNDFDSEHIYFKVIDLDVKERPYFVSETGGYTRVIPEHYYSKYNTYGYGGADTAEDLTGMITELYRKMILPGIPAGVCGSIYTQVSDVEDEVNGLYTYDRKVCKVDKKAMQKLAEDLKL